MIKGKAPKKDSFRGYADEVANVNIGRLRMMKFRLGQLQIPPSVTVYQDGKQIQGPVLVPVSVDLLDNIIGGVEEVLKSLEDLHHCARTNEYPGTV